MSAFGILVFYTFKGFGVSGTLLDWFNFFLSERRLRVVLHGAISDWVNIKAGVPQSSILGPLLFLISMNDIVNDICSNIRLFLQTIPDNPQTSAETLNADLEKVLAWAKTWLVLFNPLKTESHYYS